ncbi:MAG: hypothetical protein ACLGPL_09795 [Acidobacteriota bacterium]
MNKDTGFAAIDLGSHTIRMVVASVADGREIVPVRTERRITRLAANFDEGGTLKRPSMQESLRVLKEYSQILIDLDVRRVKCGATGVVRRAANGEEFLREVRELTGIGGSIVSEHDEALLSTRGALSVLPRPEGLVLAFDLGGSSTEFFLADPRKPDPLFITSVFIGAATATARHLPGDPPERESIRLAEKAIYETLSPTLKAIGPQPSLQIVGTAGTVTTLAAMRLKMTEYEPFRVNGLVLDADWLDGTMDRLASLPFRERREIAGLEKGREDIILGGALIVRAILRGLGKRELTVTDGGFLEGLLLDIVEKEHGLPQSLVTPLTWRLKKE